MHKQASKTRSHQNFCLTRDGSTHIRRATPTTDQQNLQAGAASQSSTGRQQGGATIADPPILRCSSHLPTSSSSKQP